MDATPAVVANWGHGKQPLAVSCPKYGLYSPGSHGVICPALHQWPRGQTSSRTVVIWVTMVLDWHIIQCREIVTVCSRVERIQIHVESDVLLD